MSLQSWPKLTWSYIRLRKVGTALEIRGLVLAGLCDNCHRALASKGVLVVNLHHDHPEHALYLSRIQQSFGAGVFELASKEKSNSVVFACRTPAVSAEQFRQRATMDDFSEPVRQQLKAEFSRLAWLIQSTG